MTQQFKTIVEVDEYFQQQIQALEQIYEKRLQTVEANCSIVLQKLKEQYNEQLAGIQRAAANKKQQLELNRVQAMQTIRQLTDNKKQQVEQHLKAEQQTLKEKTLAERLTALTEKESEERAQYEQFCQQQREHIEDTDMLAKNRDIWLEAFTHLNEQFEAVCNDLAEQYDEQLELLHEQYEQQVETLEQALEDNLQQLDDKLIDELHATDDWARDEELYHYEEYITREQELEERFAKERLKIDIDYEEQRTAIKLEQMQAFAQIEAML
jgi:hypothetical protein